MIEVFKTNVGEQRLADMLLYEIHRSFRQYSANFDLEDCDKILRVQALAGTVKPYGVIRLLNDFGFYAEVLQESINRDSGYTSGKVELRESAQTHSINN